MPFASTQKLVEATKIKDMLSTVQQEADLTPEELEKLSDNAIAFIFAQASVESNNRRLLSIPSTERKGFRRCSHEK